MNTYRMRTKDKRLGFYVGTTAEDAFETMLGFEPALRGREWTPSRWIWHRDTTSVLVERVTSFDLKTKRGVVRVTAADGDEALRNWARKCGVVLDGYFKDKVQIFEVLETGVDDDDEESTA